MVIPLISGGSDVAGFEDATTTDGLVALATVTDDPQTDGTQYTLLHATSGAFVPELQLWSGRTIDVPSAFISGKQDWGTYQRPGVYEAMQTRACSNMIGCHLVDGAGHWVQQEQPKEIARLLLEFLGNARNKS